MRCGLQGHRPREPRQLLAGKRKLASRLLEKTVPAATSEYILWVAVVPARARDMARCPGVCDKYPRLCILVQRTPAPHDTMTLVSPCTNSPRGMSVSRGPGRSRSNPSSLSHLRLAKYFSLPGCSFLDCKRRGSFLF